MRQAAELRAFQRTVRSSPTLVEPGVSRPCLPVTRPPAVTIGHIQCDNRRATIRAGEQTTAVNRLLKIAVLIVLLALVPFRGIAATVAYCASQNDSVQAQADFVQSAPDHDDRATGPHTHDGQPDCSACAEHCTGALMLLSADRMSLPGDMGADRTAHGELFAAGFIPEQLDPPPLAG